MASTTNVASEAARNSPRTAKGIERAQQIMEIAENLFHRQGYAQTSMDDIARATGLLKGSLYYYMKSKEDLLYRIVEDVHEVSRAQLDEARQQENVPALERLLHFVEAQVTYLALNVTRVAVYHHEWHRLEGDRLKSVREARHAYDDALIALLEELKAEGSLAADSNTRLVANMVLATICWPYTWYRSGTVSAAELSKTCTNFVRAGLPGMQSVT
ncbi:TetR/AcrR family transcriptional regulator [Microbacterium sp. A94]|uniref:TetR/AcrR family transcriptional regulator n=1 Tax=Microbacterium sp. A94 TaxID=3450717 RepID=UPI003F43636B